MYDFPVDLISKLNQLGVARDSTYRSPGYISSIRGIAVLHSPFMSMPCWYARQGQHQSHPMSIHTVYVYGWTCDYLERMEYVEGDCALIADGEPQESTVLQQ